MDAVSLERVSFAYGGRPVLRNLSFRIPDGNFAVVLGRNGSGKSTLLKLLAGLHPPDSGEISLCGRNLRETNTRERAGLVGYLPQFHATVFPFPVKEVVLTGRVASVAFFPTRQDRDTAREAMDAVGIAALADRPYTELSGGERQLVLIARLLAQRPKVILLDEPISHLDLANQARLVLLLRKLADTGITVVVVLHDPNAAALSADRVLLLFGGTLLSEVASPIRWEKGRMEDLYGTAVDLVPYRGTSLVVHHLGGNGMSPEAPR